MAGQESRGEYVQQGAERQPSEARHTPGPWHVDECDTDARTYIQDERDDEIACIQWAALHTDAGEQANARLIAAAPDMLAALEAALSALETPDDLTQDEIGYVIEDAYAAIAKARGQ